MKLKRLAITGYKNLIDCEVRPGNIHAITGCNGAGKSNLIEVLAFLACIQSASEALRSSIFSSGWSFIQGMDISSGMWSPISVDEQSVRNFELCIECEIMDREIAHEVSYKLKFDAPTESHGGNQFRKGSAIISAESVTAKATGTPGKAPILLTRKGQLVTVNGGKTERSKVSFTCRNDMSALHALEFRDADKYKTDYPILAAFRQAILSNILIRLDADTFRKSFYMSDVGSQIGVKLTSVVESYDPYQLLLDIRKVDGDWVEFQDLLRNLVGVSGLYMNQIAPGSEASSGTRFIMPLMHDRILNIGELSMGSSIAIGILTILFASRRGGGMAVFEEPENYLHPGAIVGLIRLFRDFSRERSVMFSTHSPVALNCLKPSEVTVMRSRGFGFVTTKTVSDIPEALAALNRSILSFGDLLESNFELGE